MELFYISPSELPSRSANAVHVVHMCNALGRLGLDVTLFAKRSIADDRELLPNLQRLYGVDLDNVRIVSFFSNNSRGDNLRIAALGLRRLWNGNTTDLIVSRNLYASFVLGGLLGRPLVFETHQLESGVRKWLQRIAMRGRRVLTLAISKRLIEALTRHHGLAPVRSLVLPDAAPAGIKALSADQRKTLRDDWLKAAGQSGATSVCGYFGHLYPGRGVEIIEQLAQARPTLAFLVFGGTEADIAARKADNPPANLHFMGFLPHSEVRQAMAAMDVLLMPYQARVSIGIEGHDTAEWMSPMKMFEYMATGVPIIASRLPALQEVLEDGQDCLMAESDAPDEWLSRLDDCLSDPSASNALAANARNKYLQEYNWDVRASRLLDAISS